MGISTYILQNTQVADPNGIYTAATPTAGAITLAGALVSGTVATLTENDLGVQVTVECTGDETGNTITIVGTDYSGKEITEQHVGVSATTFTFDNFYKTVTSISVSENAANNLTIGTTAVTVSPWFKHNIYQNPANTTVRTEVRGHIVVGMDDYDYECIEDHTAALATAGRPGTGPLAARYWRKLHTKGKGLAWVDSSTYVAAASATLNYTVSYTLDNLQESIDRPLEKDLDDTDLVAATASQISNFAYPFGYSRAKLNTWTDGALMITFVEGKD